MVILRINFEEENPVDNVAAGDDSTAPKPARSALSCFDTIYNKVDSFISFMPFEVISRSLQFSYPDITG